MSFSLMRYAIVQVALLKIECCVDVVSGLRMLVDEFQIDQI